MKPWEQRGVCFVYYYILLEALKMCILFHKKTLCMLFYQREFTLCLDQTMFSGIKAVWRINCSLSSSSNSKQLMTEPRKKLVKKLSLLNTTAPFTYSKKCTMSTKETKYFKTSLRNLQMHFEVQNERYLTIFSKLISTLNFHRRVWKADRSCLLEPEWSTLSSDSG